MKPSLGRSKIAYGTHIKWGVFRLLERLSDLKGNSTAGHLALNVPAKPLASLWVFVSTIGELNAIDPLLRQIVTSQPQLKLVLITDHPHYRESYLARYPAAEICVTRGHGADAATLATHYPPQLLVVAEIPCWPSDAPCRFSFAFLLAAKQAGAATVLVNAWLYHYSTASRMDAIERSLFQTDFVRAFDAVGAQTPETRDNLLAVGADPNRVQVVGNIKFDAMPPNDWTPALARSPAMLGALIASGRPVIVAGCITDYADQHMVLDAFVSVRQLHPDALLVLAPRHPEVAKHMEALRGFLAKRSLVGVFKSTVPDAPMALGVACLVLDTMGELRDFYAAATVAHVGVDHNVLEPLGFGKPVTVGAGWNTTYPSYPVYRLLSDAHTLLEATTADQLACTWLDLIDNADHYRSNVQATGNTLAKARGAVARHLNLLAPFMPKI